VTVIVALPDRMLSDSICTSGETNFPTTKIFRIRGCLVGVAGDNAQIERFLRWFAGSRKKPLEGLGDELEVVVLNKKGIWDYRGSMPDRVTRGVHGVGTGWGFAYAAILAGADPHRAIEITCQVTHLCGLPVQEFIL
jgi:hypothetical protein